MGRRDEPIERHIVQLPDGGERIDALGEQRLVAPDVADPRDRPLIEKCRRDRRAGPGRIAQPSARLGEMAGSPIVIEEIRAERGERRVDRGGARLEQLNDRCIEADGDGARDLEHEPRP